MSNQSSGPFLIESSEEKEQRERAEDKRRERRHNQLQLWFNGILTTATILTAGIVLYQNRILVQSLDEQRKQAQSAIESVRAAIDGNQLTRDSLEEVRKANGIASNVAGAASEANRLSTESTRGRLQWRIRLREPIALERPIKVTVHYENKGKSDVIVQSRTAVQRWGNLPDGEPPLPEFGKKSVLEPDAAVDLLLTDRFPVDQSVIENIRKSGLERPFFFGQIKYETLGREYLISFCAYPMALDTRSVPESDQTDPNFVLRQCQKWY